MKLYSSNRRELAFIAFAIKKAKEGNNSRQGYLGRTALQKIMYFIVRKGVPLPYQFEIYNYGPFCSDIYPDVECLERNKVLVDNSNNLGTYWDYAPGENIDELLDQYRSDLEEYEDTINEVVQVFADLRPDTLELIATLDYLYQDEKARKGAHPEKPKVVERFLQVKEKFSRETVEKAYDTLLKLGIFNN